MDPRDEAFWVESAASAASNPSAWLASADSLWRAAEAVLAETKRDLSELAESGHRFAGGGLAGWIGFISGRRLRPFVSHVYMLLAGLALEDLLKGLAVASNPALVQPRPDNPRRLLDWAGSGHVSRRLAGKAGVALSSDEAQLIDKLEVFVTWGGRYPVPLDALKMQYKLSEGAPPASWSSDDVPRIETLFERLKADLELAAQQLAARSTEEDLSDRRARRATLLGDLESMETSDREGVKFFERSGEAEDPGSHTVCCACGAELPLSPARPAAVCRCDVLYYGERWYDGSVGREFFNVEQYPPPAEDS